MSGWPSHQQGYADSGRPLSTRGESSHTATAAPAVDGTNPPESEQRSATTPIQSPAQPRFRVPQSPRSATGESQTKAAKVAIPRLKRSLEAVGEGSTRSGGRHRVNHACEPCRHRKTKCSGERPFCRHCQDFKIACFYADGKRDRVKKQFGSMTEKVADYERLLRELVSRVSDEDAKLIKVSLDKATQVEVDDTATESATAASVEVDLERSASGAESEASGGVGSTGALERTDEDFTREGARVTGYMGKNSEVTWIQRLRQENKFGDSPPGDASEETRQIHNISSSSLHNRRAPSDETVPLPEAVDGFTINDSSYHLDDLAITTFEAIDPYELPTRETAQILFNVYMQRVAPTFPIVGQVNLSSQFYKYVSSPVQQAPAKWLAIVNMIFAISAKYSHLIQAEWKGDERDHLIYFNRARLLTADGEAMFAHPDLQQIQVLGLMSFYLMCSSQMNRAWTLNGMAIRHAVALGLNMRNESANLKDSLKEIRYRLWWALYTMEYRLCSITGRVNCILDDNPTTPLPVPLDEDKFDTEEGQRLLSKQSQQQDRAPSLNSHSPSVNSPSIPHERSGSSNKSDQSRSPSTLHMPQSEFHWAKDVPPTSSLYFLHYVQLTRLVANVFHHLYSPVAIERTWSYVQSQIQGLDEQLDGWCKKLPSIFDFRRKQRDRDFYEFRLNLGFFYYSTKQMINRPCLCRIDRKIPDQSNRSHKFNRASAAACVEAAQDMLRLIPDEPNAVGLIRVGPWWAILSYLVQAATVLMLEMSFRAHHMPEDAESVLESSKKVIRWLHALGEDNLSARRAWQLCYPMLRDAAVKIGREVNDLPDKAPGRESDASSEGATSMSGVSAGHMHNSGSANMSNHMYNNTMLASMYPGFSGLDHMMPYDQYYPTGSMAHNNQYNVGPATDAEMEFMANAYLDERGDHHHHHQQQQLPGNNPSRDPMGGGGHSFADQ